jgi:hypothetical protein
MWPAYTGRPLVLNLYRYADGLIADFSLYQSRRNAPTPTIPLGRRQAVTYDHWKATEPDPYAHEPVGECHWCGHRAVLYRTWLCYPVEAWVCGDCLDERSSPLLRSTAAGRLGSE